MHVIGIVVFTMSFGLPPEIENLVRANESTVQSFTRLRVRMKTVGEGALTFTLFSDFVLDGPRERIEGLQSNRGGKKLQTKYSHSTDEYRTWSDHDPDRTRGGLDVDPRKNTGVVGVIGPRATFGTLGKPNDVLGGLLLQFHSPRHGRLSLRGLLGVAKTVQSLGLKGGLPTIAVDIDKASPTKHSEHYEVSLDPARSNLVTKVRAVMDSQTNVTDAIYEITEVRRDVDSGLDFPMAALTTGKVKNTFPGELKQEADYRVARKVEHLEVNAAVKDADLVVEFPDHTIVTDLRVTKDGYSPVSVWREGHATESFHTREEFSRYMTAAPLKESRSSWFPSPMTFILASAAGIAFVVAFYLWLKNRSATKAS